MCVMLVIRRFSSTHCQRQASPEPSLTQITDPDKTISGLQAPLHVVLQRNRAFGMPMDTSITDGPVINLRVCVFVGVVLAGSVSAASAQDAALGEKVFLKCKACHQIGEGAKNAVGPVLNGIIGRRAGTYQDYSYSDANKGSGITWDAATLKDYLKNPRAKIPGTKMIFPGLPKDDDIDNVIAYLKQFGADGKKS
jgi:cytochrome c